MNKSANRGFYRHQIGKLSRGAVLDVGLKCTHSCKFCYYSFLGGSDDQFLGIRRAKFRTLAECKEILKLLKQNGFTNFDYTGGEPCLHPDIVEISRYAHQELDLKGRIITLGQWLTQKKGNSERKKLIDSLLDAGLTNFLFSLHAADEELFARSTGEKYSKLHDAMCYLDDKGFQYTSNTVIYEWNYRHLPDLAMEITRHGIYLHNFIIMNAYYSWNKDGKAFGVQAKYSEIYPYLMEAVDILESNYIAVNIRYAPLCAVRGKEKNLVGIVGVRYDPYEWMNLAGHMGGLPEYCASVIPIKEGEIEAHLALQPANGPIGPGVMITGTRGNMKYFCEKCTQCGARGVCDGIDPNYLKFYGTGEFTPYEQIERAPLQAARYRYQAPFLVKTEQFADMKSAVAETFRIHSPESIPKPNVAEPVKISVIIPCYNYGHYLADAVESVICQTWQNFEIIIVNDGSTDNTEQIANDLIRQYPSHKIILINQPNSGQPAISRNNGISGARGQFILCLDADDKIAPTMLSECLLALEKNPEASIAYTDRQDFDGVETVVKARSYDFEMLKHQNHLSYCALFKRKVWDDVGGYRLNVRGCEDWDFWISAGAKGHTGIYIPLPLFLYRRHDTGIYQDVTKNYSKIFARIILNNMNVYKPHEIASARSQLGISVKLEEAAPMVSVVIPTCNRPERLVMAVKSVLNQTYRNIELIVINDGGVEVGSLLTGLRTDVAITYISFNRNRERSIARNAGLKVARGKYIAYLDDDDIYYPDHVEALVNFLECTNFKVAYTDAYAAIEETTQGRYHITNKQLVHSRNFDKEHLLTTNYIPILCVMHEKSCIEHVGYFDETLHVLEDWDLWIRMSRKFPFAHLKKITAEYSWRDDTTTNTRRHEFVKAADYIKIKYSQS